MGTFDLILISTAICGLFMVLGALYLLASGAISLRSETGRGHTEFTFANYLKIATTTPALGLFVIGILFMGLALRYGDPVDELKHEVDALRDENMRLKLDVEHSEVHVVGQIITASARGDSDVLVQICAPRHSLRAPPLDMRIRPNVESLHVVISAPGHRIEERTLTRLNLGLVYGSTAVAMKDGRYDIGKVQLSATAAKPESAALEVPHGSESQRGSYERNPYVVYQ